MSMRLFSKAAGAAAGGSPSPTRSPTVTRAGSKESAAESGRRGGSTLDAAEFVSSPQALKRHTFYELVGALTQEYDHVRDRLGEACAENARLRYHLEEKALAEASGSAAGGAARKASKQGAGPQASARTASRVGPAGSHARSMTMTSSPLREPEEPESPRSLPPDLEVTEEPMQHYSSHDSFFSDTSPPPVAEPISLKQVGPQAGAEAANRDSPTAKHILSDGCASDRVDGRMSDVSVRFAQVVTEERFESLNREDEADPQDRTSFASVCSLSSQKSMTDSLMLPSGSAVSGGLGDEFELLPVWVKRIKKGSRRNSDTQKVSIPLISNYVSAAPEVERCFILRLMSNIVIRPSSRVAALWDTLTVCVLLWDLVVIPLSAYELPESEVWGTMEFVATIVWTCDIVVSLLRGFEVAGDVEMRPRRIIRHYARTWMVFDFSLVGVDWALFVLEEGDLVDFLRFSRFRRALRLLRLARLLKHGRRFLALAQHVQSEEWLVILRIVWLLVVLIAINHFISCAWYAIGTAGLFDDSWVEKAFDLDSKTHGFGYRYLTSFHWSVTQFTPASMEVVPRNPLERACNIMMIFLGLLMFSSFISNMTNGMTYLTKRNYEKRQERDALIAYMNAKGISLKLRHDIITFCGAKSAARRRSLNEEDIASFRGLPDGLLEKLHVEVHAPVLQMHALFSQLYSDERTVIYLLCHHALSDRTIGPGEDLFKFGIRCTRMYFLINGKAKYTLGYGEGDEAPAEVLPRQWISEACLWFLWDHRGRLQGLQLCEMSELNALEFQTLMSRSAMLIEVQRYARLYANHAERESGGAEYVTDLWGQRLRVMDLVQKSFRPDQADEDNPASKVMQMWRGNEMPIGLVFGEWRFLVVREKHRKVPGLLKKLYAWYIDFLEARRLRKMRQQYMAGISPQASRSHSKTSVHSKGSGGGGSH